MKNKKNFVGLDTVDLKPDYTKSWEENCEILKKRYIKAYGEYPKELDKEKRDES